MTATRCLLFGVGAVGCQAARDLIDTGMHVVGAYTRSRHLGTDLGKLVGRPPNGVRIGSITEFRARPDLAEVALFFTTSTLADLHGAAADCLRHGIDVLTIAEEALYPWISNPTAAADLDEIARAGGATLCGVGINDAVMVHLPAVATAFCGAVRSIEIDCTGDFGRLGPSTLSAMSLGQPSGPPAPAILTPASRSSICAQVADALYGLFGLRASHMQAHTEPLIARHSISVPGLGLSIGPGTVRGFVEILEAQCDDGPDINVRLSGKVFEAGEEEYLEARVHGNVVVTTRVAPLRSVEGTASTAIRRIPDVLGAAPGFVTTERLRAPFGRAAYAL